MLIADLHERVRQHVLATVKSRQLTQATLAELICVRQAHISNFLLGRRGLSIEAMDAVMRVLGIDVTNLVAMSEERALKDRSTVLESVPLVRLRVVMNPTFAEDEILGQLGFSRILVRRFSPYPTEARKPWTRFIAVRADAALSAPMYPRIENGSVLLVDRHDCSLAGYRKDEPSFYMIRKEKTLMVRRVEMMGAQLCLRPEATKYPLTFICMNKKTPLTSYIVGRVAHIATRT